MEFNQNSIQTALNPAGGYFNNTQVAGPTAPTVPAPTVPGVTPAKAGTNLSGVPISQLTLAPASTVTQSNSNKMDAVPGIISKTKDFADTGISTDASGNPTYANGTIVPQPDDNKKEETTSTSTGGYVGDVYYPAGAPVPLGPDGKPAAMTPTSPTDDHILASLNSLKASVDATTASLIDSIQANYNNLIEQQKLANADAKTQLAAGTDQVNNALLMGGVTGQGSSAQFAPISSAGIQALRGKFVQSQVAYGIQQIANLNSKEQSDIIAAQTAGFNNDFQLMNEINDRISKTRDEKVAATTKLNDQIAEEAKKKADEKLAADKDAAVATLYESGVTDPTEILKKLKEQGIDMTSKEVADTLTNITPSIQERQLQMAAIQHAQELGVTKPFYLVGNTAIDSNTGLPVSLQEYQKATGQAGKSEADTDFSFIQTVATPDVKALKDKYPDANILDTDTLEQATAKVKSSSQIYKKETYIAPSSGSYTTPIGSPSVTDSSTDTAVAAIIASNPGEYGKAADAIDAQFGKGTATKYDSWLKAVYEQGQDINSIYQPDPSLLAQGLKPIDISRLSLSATRIASQYIKSPIYEAVANGAIYLQRINAADQVPGSVSDEDLLDSLVKLNTGGNAVTDSQVRLITDGKSLADSINVWGQKLNKGGVLSPDQREQIKSLANKVYENYQKAYTPIYQQATSQLKSAGIPQSLWTIPDWNKLSGQITADSGTIRVKEKSSGQTGTIPASEFDPNLYEKI